MLYPTTLLDVLASQVNEALCCGGVVPVPLAVSTVEPLEALLANVMLAEVEPDAVGAKVTVNCVLYPAGIVVGKAIPLTEYSFSLTVTPVTVTGPLLAVSVPDWLWLVPSVISPKLALPGVTANCPGAIPVPVSETLSVGSEALEFTARLPFALPPAWGAKTTLNLTLCPAVRTTGGVIPE